MGDGEKRKIAWVSWRKVCGPKIAGGLALKDLDLFNLSLLGKWKWRLINDEGACWQDIITL